MRVSIPFDALRGTLFSLLLVSKLSLVQGQGCNYPCITPITSLECTANTASGCTQCWDDSFDDLGPYCTYPSCGGPCPPGPGGDDVCAGSPGGCTKCVDIPFDYGGYFSTHSCQEPPGLPSSSPSSLPSSSPSSIPSQKPSAPTKKKTKKTKTRKKKAKMPTVQMKKTRKSKK